MRRIIIFILVIFFVSNISAQIDYFKYDWLLTKVNFSDRVVEPYQDFKFTKDGKLFVMGIEVAAWKYDKSQNSIILKSQFDKDFNGTMHILESTENRMVMEKGGAKYYYDKIDNDKIAEDNAKSLLKGIWKSETEEGETNYIKFQLPDSLTVVNLFEGGSSVSTGRWIYRPKENSFVVMAQSHFCDGKNKLLLNAENKLKFQNKEKVISALKIADSPVAIEKLDFTEDDLYNDERKEVPQNWMDSYQFIESLLNVKSLVYQKGNLLNNLGIYNFSDMQVGINVNEDDQKIVFSYFTIAKNDTQIIGTKTKDQFNQNPFFPVDEPVEYRVMGKETVVVPAGKFDCTVIEAISDFDKKQKLWMIDNKPGIYAKIITSWEDFGELNSSIEILKEIK